jgi:hypothetical protein
MKGARALFVFLFLAVLAIAQDADYPFKRLKFKLSDPRTEVAELVAQHPELTIEHITPDYVEAKLLKTEFDKIVKRTAWDWTEVVRLPLTMPDSDSIITVHTMAPCGNTCSWMVFMVYSVFPKVGRTQKCCSNM